MNESVLPHNRELGRNWGAPGDRYEAFSEHFADAIACCVEAVHARAGERVLDIATGTGWAARHLARTGASVVGVDFAEGMILSARHLGRAAGLEIDFRVGDVEALTFEDASFDGVVSSFGAIFAGDHARTAAEIGRVCKPGGRLAMTAWTPQGSIGLLSRAVFWKYMPKPATPMLLWGEAEYAHRLLGDAFDLRCETLVTTLRAPSPEAVWDLWSRSQGTTLGLLARLSEAQGQALRADFIAFHDQFARDGEIVMPREYCLYVGTRS